MIETALKPLRRENPMNLKELSEKLGLSQTTVSRALGGYPEVKESTRKRVAEAADRYNYRPSRRATHLATGRSMSIGHVIPLSSNHEMVNPIFSDFLAGAGEVYARAGYDMLLSVVRDQDELSAYRDFATKGAVDGVIVHGPRLDDPRIGLLQEIGLPFVVHGRAPSVDTTFSCVDVNNGSAFRRATELLIELGHRRIALVNGLETMDFAQRRRRGFGEAMAGAGLDIDPALMFSDEMTEHLGHRAMSNMLALEAPPTAVLASSIIVGIGVRRAIHEAGLKYGRDISVVIHDDALSYLRNGETVPLFTATRSSVRAAGVRCAEILLRQITDRTLPPVQEIWECDLVIGQSTGPLRD